MVAIWVSLAVGAAGQVWASPLKPAKPLNVLIIGADTLRADHLSLHGYKLPTSPNLERLSAKGVVFDWAFSQGSYTLPSFASFFTSRYPEQHKATSRRSRIRGSETTLAEVFQRNGYRTNGLTGGPNLNFQYGFGKGFDSYLGGDLPRRLDDYIPVLLEWIDGGRAEPFFLFVQPQDVHPPFDMLDIPPPERNRWDPDYDGPVEKFLGSFYFFRAFNDEPYDAYGPVPPVALQRELDEVKKDPRSLRHMASVYDDRVAHLDRSLGSLWEALERRGVLDNTVIVLMSDHGTLFGEGGKFTHGHHFSTHDGIFHVTLVVWAPGRKPGRVRSLVELLDVAPTILELAGLPVPRTFEGRSLIPLMDGRKEDRGRLVFGAATSSTNEARWKRFVRDERWKFVSDDPGGATALYDLAADPAEERDVSAGHPDVAKRLAGELARRLQRSLSRSE